MTLCSTLRGVFFILPVLDLEIYFPLYRGKGANMKIRTFINAKTFRKVSSSYQRHIFIQTHNA